MSPLSTTGGIGGGGGGRGSQIQKYWEAVKRLDRFWHQIWYNSADSFGNGHRLNTIRLSIPQGVLRGVNILKVLGSCHTTGLIGTTFGTRLRIRLGMDIG